MKNSKLLVAILSAYLLSACNFTNINFSIPSSPSNEETSSPSSDSSNSSSESSSSESSDSSSDSSEDSSSEESSSSDESSSSSSSSSSINDTITFNVVAFNDYHGQILQTSSFPGLEKFGSYLLKQKQNNPDTIIINSGDSFQGTGESDLNHGNLITDVFNYVKVDTTCIGNHEFDWGADSIIDNINRSITSYDGTTYSMNWLNANIYDYDIQENINGNTLQTQFGNPYYIKELSNGVKVGIVGAIGDDNISSISSELVKDYCFKEPYSIMKSISDDLRVNKGCDVIIGSIHDPYKEGNGLSDISNVSNKKYYDLVLNAHTHVKEKYNENGTYYVQCDDKGENIANISITVDKHSAAINSVNYVSKSTISSTTSNSHIKNYIESALAPQEDILNEVLTSKVTGDWYSSEQLPNLMCEAIYKEYYAKYQSSVYSNRISMVLCNGGRVSLKESYYGDNWTFSDLYEVFPFDNTVPILTVSGYYLRRVLNRDYICAYSVLDNVVENSKTTYYNIAILDYLAFHTNDYRKLDYFPKYEVLDVMKKQDGSSYLYRDILCDYLRNNKDKTFKASSYSSDNYYFDKTNLLNV